MRSLSFVMPYYMNPHMLADHYARWSAYPKALSSKVSFVIVDDGSPQDPAFNVPRPEGLDIQIYRILVDKPWNQHGARNLGAKQADGEWLFLTDMDHAMPVETLAHVFRHVGKRDHVHTFARVDAPDMKPTRRPDGTKKPHPNTFLMTKRKYWEIGGYDEDFCGVYGTDGLFRARIKQRSKQEHIEHPIIRYPREVVDDASTTTLSRKDGEYRLATKALAKKKRQEGRENKIVTINFKWERVL